MAKILVRAGVVTVVCLMVVGTWFALARRDTPERVSYGVSFSALRAEDLGLDWRETYRAILDDLGVRKLRLMAHWNRIEPEDDVFAFAELDEQMREAEMRGAKVILAIGRKVPGWPECHVPDWAKTLDREARDKELFEYMRAVVERYKNSPALALWQVENEPFLHYALEQCGAIEQEEFVRSEVGLVRSLDPAHPVMVTDSGEFGRWFRAHRIGDVFGTSLYLYIHYDGIGFFRYPIGPSFFRLKRNLVEQFNGVRKPVILSELAAEPWLTVPTIEAPIDVQLQRMSANMFREMLEVAREAGFEEQYLWGAEWWYWLKQHGYPEHWEMARPLFQQIVR